MPPAISVPGVSLWGANEVRPASGSNAPAVPASAYNTNYLKPDPRTFRHAPIPQPEKFRSVAGSSVARAEFPSEVAPSAYNADYLRSANALRYPPISPPLSNEAAFAILRGSEDADVAKAEAPHHYSPVEVIELLKLLQKGDIPDEQMEAYIEDANRMRAYAALSKERALNDLEQQEVDETGARLAREARELVAEDVGFVQAKRNEIGGLNALAKTIANEQKFALRAGQEAELRRQEAEHEAKKAEGDVAHFASLSGEIGLKIADVEAELEGNYPWAGKKEKAKLRAEDEATLDSLREDKLKIDDAALDATVAQADYERQRDEAEAERYAHLATMHIRDRALPDATAALDLATITDRAVNPRFSASKSKKQAQLLATAVEISQAGPAAENKLADSEFALAQTPKGPVEQFISFNLGHNRTDKKFFSNAALVQEWAEYARKNTQVPASPPWLLEKNRQSVLKSVFESKKVPSEFKLELLRKAGY